MSRLGIELLSVFGMNPVDHARLAAELGCGYISTGLTQLPFNPHGYASWSLRDDAGLRRELIAVTRACDVAVSLGEGFTIRPGAPMAARGPEMDLFAELGALCLGASSMAVETAQLHDELALFAGMAAERGMKATLELVPGSPAGTLRQALEAVRFVNRPNFGLLLDSMHFFRAGGTLEELRALGRDVVFYAQLCDVPMPAIEPDYMREAMFGRLIPGEGELPLREFCAALPADVPVGLEVPMLAKAEAGMGPKERLAPAIDAARALF